MVSSMPFSVIRMGTLNCKAHLSGTEKPFRNVGVHAALGDITALGIVTAAKQFAGSAQVKGDRILRVIVQAEVILCPFGLGDPGIAKRGAHDTGEDAAGKGHIDGVEVEVALQHIQREPGVARQHRPVVMGKANACFRLDCMDGPVGGGMAAQQVGLALERPA